MTPLARRLHAAEVACTLLAFLGGGAALSAAFGATSMLAVALVGALVWPVARALRLRSSTLLEAALTLVGGFLGYRLGLLTPEPAAGLAMFLLVAQATKLICPRGPRDGALARIVGVVLAGVAAAEGVELHFGVALAACVLLLLLSAMFSAINEQLAAVSAAEHAPTAAPSVGGTPSRARIVSSHALLVGALGLLTGATFLVIPRMGAKLLPRRSTSVQRLAGFSDVVGLEDIGRIKRNDSVAFRAELSTRAPLQSPYWRGAVLDQYDGSNWKTSELLSWGLRLEALDALSMQDPMAETSGPALEATMYLEPIGSRYLFTLGTVESVHFKNARPRRLRRSANGAYTVARPSAVSLAYRLRYRPAPVPRLLLNPTLKNHVLRTCLRIPGAINEARMRAFTRRVLQGAGLANVTLQPSQLASVLERYLRNEFRYTTESTRDPSLEPVEEFLYVKRSGHCEFFASALAVLLRCEGIPARVITGFRGGDYNSWTGTYTVRQREAHAWTEALVEDGWRRLDATPADPVGAGGDGLLGAAAQLGDWVELKWFQYVIAFDAYDQQNALFLLRERLAPYREELERALAQPWGRILGGLLALLLATTVGAAAARLLGRRPWRGGLVFAGAPSDPRATAVARVLAALARQGLVRRPDETPLELARRAQGQLQLPRAGLCDWVPGYYAARYGGRSLSDSQQAELEQLVAQLEQLDAPAG